MSKEKLHQKKIKKLRKKVKKILENPESFQEKDAQKIFDEIIEFEKIHGEINKSRSQDGDEPKRLRNPKEKTTGVR